MIFLDMNIIMFYFLEYIVMVEDFFNNRIFIFIFCCVLFCVWVWRIIGMGLVNL